MTEARTIAGTKPSELSPRAQVDPPREGGSAPESGRQTVPCPLCGSGRSAVLIEPTEHIHDPRKLYGAASGIRGTQRIVRCSDCSMMYENPRLSEQAIVAGYASADDAGHDSQHHMRVKSFAWSLKRFSKRLPKPPATILDVGTAGGAFLEAARDFGYTPSGVEPSQYLTNAACARGFDVRAGTLADGLFEGSQFDVVSMWDVVEHLCDPRDAVTRVHDLLKPGGTFLLNFPDSGTWQAKLAGKRFWWLLSVHVSYFTKKTMRKLLEDAGFEVSLIARHWQVLELGYLFGIAAHLGVPLAGTVGKLLPGFLASIPMPYYASQTTVIARKKQ
jgi:SAM-dependent methyltransferase